MFENRNLHRLIPYKLSSHKAWEVKDSENVLKLDWNEATIKPSPNVIAAIHAAIENSNLNWYPNTNNIDLRRKIAKYVKIELDQVQYFASSDALHEYIVQAFVEESDRILIVNPTYDNFRAVVESAGGHIQYYPLNENFDLDFCLFSHDLNLINPKVVYLVNPNNPTGTQYKVDSIERLIEQHQDILFIIDEAYYEFSGITCANLCTQYKNLIISRTFSKAFAMASFRIGFAISCKENIISLNKVRNPKNVSLLAQVAAEAALDDIKYTLKYVAEVNKTKNEFDTFLSSFGWVKVYNGEGNFLFLEFDTVSRKNELKKFLASKKIFIRDYGHLVNTKKYLRISIGTSQQMAVVKDSIIKFSNSYK